MRWFVFGKGGGFFFDRGEREVPIATCAPFLPYFLPISMMVGSSISFPSFAPLE